MRSNDFDWSSDHSVLVRSYGSIAVYGNPHGDVVIRQECDALQDEDDIVIIPLTEAELIAQEILDIAKAIRIDLAHECGTTPAPIAAKPPLALPAPRGQRLLNLSSSRVAK